MDGGAKLLQPDEAAIRDFLTRLFGRCEREYPGGWIELRYPSTGGRWESDWFRADKLGIEGATTKTKTVNGNGRNVYVGVNPRNPLTSPFGSGSARDVEIAFVHLIDLDDPAAYKDAKTKAAALPPTFWSITGTVPAPRAHLYWELEEPTRNLTAWTAQQRALAQHFGSDDAIIDPPRIIRVAGTVSYPDKKKSERGYVEELTRAYFFDAQTGEVRDPVLSEAVRQAYPGKVIHNGDNNFQAGAGLEPSGFNLERTANPMDWVTAIRSQSERHNNALRLAAHLVATGASDWTITTLLEELLRGRSDGGTVDEIPGLIKSAREKWNTPDPGVKETPEPQGEFVANLIPAGFDITKLERRPWLFGRVMLRKNVTMLIAPGGVGKSLLTIRFALSIVSGKPWGRHVVHKPGPFWLFNAEDDLDEVYRRVFGAAKQMGLSQDEWRSRLFINSGADRQFIVAQRSRDSVIRTPDVGACIEQIKGHNMVGGSFDPFVEMHSVSENDNGEINKATGMFRDIAQEANCGVLLVHHTRKPPDASSEGYAGDMNTARGGGAIGGVIRVAFTLVNMSPDDAKEIGVSPSERHKYVRFDEAKANLSARDPSTIWLEKVSVGIGNYDALGAPEDEVGAFDVRDFTAEIKARDDAAEAARRADAEVIWRALQPGKYTLADAAEVVMPMSGWGKERTVEDRIKAALRPPFASDKFGNSQIYLTPPPNGKKSPYTVVKEDAP